MKKLIGLLVAVSIVYDLWGGLSPLVHKLPQRSRSMVEYLKTTTEIA